MQSYLRNSRDSDLCCNDATRGVIVVFFFRSGTFCTVHINLNIIKKHFETHFKPPPLNIVETILALRKQRPGMVQTKEQFVFAYQAILEEYLRMHKEAKKRYRKREAERKEEQGTEGQEQGHVSNTSSSPTAPSNGDHLINGKNTTNGSSIVNITTNGHSNNKNFNTNNNNINNVNNDSNTSDLTIIGNSNGPSYCILKDPSCSDPTC